MNLNIDIINIYQIEKIDKKTKDVRKEDVSETKRQTKNSVYIAVGIISAEDNDNN